MTQPTTPTTDTQSVYDDYTSMPYIGGFFDGEGHVSYFVGRNVRKLKSGTKAYYYGRFDLAFTQTGDGGLFILRRIKDRLLGELPDDVHLPIYSRVINKGTHNETIVHCLKATGKVAAALANLLLPYVIMKRADLVDLIQCFQAQQAIKETHGAEEIQNIFRRKYLSHQVRSGAGGYLGRTIGKGSRGRMWEQVGYGEALDVLRRPADPRILHQGDEVLAGRPVPVLRGAAV